MATKKLGSQARKPPKKRPKTVPKAAPVSRRRAAAARNEPRFGPVEVFYAQAIAIEREATARYREFAHQMTGYGNARTAELFLRLAQFESEHAERLLESTAGMKLPSVEQIRRGLVAGSVSEVATYEFLYRRVLPHHALLMALAGERRAKAYFERIRKTSGDPKVRKLAAALARDEAEHIVWIERVLEAEPQTVQRFDELAD
jgi:rubrerythrin